MLHNFIMKIKNYFYSFMCFATSEILSKLYSLLLLLALLKSDDNYIFNA